MTQENERDQLIVLLIEKLLGGFLAPPLARVYHTPERTTAYAFDPTAPSHFRRGYPVLIEGARNAQAWCRQWVDFDPMGSPADAQIVIDAFLEAYPHLYLSVRYHGSEGCLAQIFQADGPGPRVGWVDAHEIAQVAVCEVIGAAIAHRGITL